MKHDAELTFKDGNSSTLYFLSLDEPTECPLCKRSIKPELLHAHLYKNNDNKFFVSSTFLCNGCFQAFVCLSKVNSQKTDGKYSTDVIYIGPSIFAPVTFDPLVEACSPQFVKIYNQALEAESNNLDEIAGIGYRKALEFLVKDFCIHFHNTEIDSIKEKSLSVCIKQYIDNSHIKTLAEKATWIGNDETHYTRKIEDRDITDMKKFIQALVYFVGMVLITEDAESVEHG